MMAETARYRWAFTAAAAVAVGVGVLGLLDLRRAPYAGFVTFQHYDIVRVKPGSPAERAGLLPGDEVHAVDGIRVSDTKALWRRPRAEIGETRTYCVKRDGEIREVDITFCSVPRSYYLKAGLSFGVGLCFLVFPLWAYRVAPSLRTTILTLFGLCFSLTFFPIPYARNFHLRTLTEALVTIVVAAGFAFLIHYLMLFPSRRPLLDKSWGLGLLYLPATLVGLLVLGLILFQPDFTAGVRRTLSWVLLVFNGGYFGAALVALAVSFRRASPPERSRSGLGMMLAGAVFGLLPLIVGGVLGRLAPELALPGEAFYSVLFGLIPITFALAAVRHHRNAPLPVAS